MLKRFCFTLIAVMLISTQAAASESSLAVLPGEMTLHGPATRHRLLVVSVEDGLYTGPPNQEISLTSSDEKIVRIAGGTAVPVANGTATITATVGDRRATCKVTVAAIDQPHQWSFRNHVEPVLAKYGCSTGACHGALAGKGGFRLTLRGYDPVADHHTITRQAGGRRIELADPGRSMILAKPSGAIPHKGGLRFETGSHPYQVLAEWIGAGAPSPREDDPRLSRLEVLPAQSILSSGVKQQLTVRAHYTDGRVEDVTHWAKYTATNQAVAGVNDEGLVTVSGHGQGAVRAWFSSQIVVARISSPYPNDVPDEVYAKAPRRNFIDELVLAKLKSLRLPPSLPCTDEEFVRRAYLDTIGKLPTAEEAQKFLADTSPDKRDKLIDALLEREEFVDYWTYKWSDVMLVTGRRLRPAAVKAYYQWIRKQVEQNTPWDTMVRSIVTASGSSIENGATNFFAVHQTPEDMTENTCQAFLSLSIGCARCHNHPMEKWTNNQYYAMANLFARVRGKGWGGDPRNGDGKRALVVLDRGNLMQPQTGKPQPPAPLDEEPIPMDDPGDRREYLAEWLTSPDNPYFTKAITNRLWANFFGVGIVDPVDDLRLSNPASNEPLLKAAADYLVEHQFDLKSLMRVILQSKTYQRSSAPLPENAEENRFYSRYYPRRMMAEVLHDAIVQVTGVPSTFDQITTLGAATVKTDEYPKGTKAIELHDAAVASYFLDKFGRNKREITCECERSDEPSMVQVLHISNGETINKKLATEGNNLDALLAAKLSDEKLIEQAYLMTLSRRPTIQEKAKLLSLFAESTDVDRRVLLEDLFWSILSSQEFLFNH